MAVNKIKPKAIKKTIEYFISPVGEKFPIPPKSKYAAEFRRVKKQALKARAEGKEIVVVMGVGFVGSVMAGIIADSTDKKGCRTKFVIGCQRPSTRSYWKIPLLNQGRAPVKAEDPEVDEIIKRCVLKKKTLTATYNKDVLKLADCVVVDVHWRLRCVGMGRARANDAGKALAAQQG